MSYSLELLRTFTRRYINEEDSSNSHFTDDELNDYLNQAVIFLGTQMEWPVQIETTAAVQDQALYQLPSDFVSLVDAYFDNSKLRILDRADMGGVSTVWQQDPSSTPKVLYRASQSVFGLYPPPDSTQSGKLVQIQYIQMPATLSQDADIPDLHDAFHICLPFYAAFICDYKLGNDKKSELHLQRYEQHRKALMSKVQNFSDDIKRFRWAWPLA